MWGYDSSAHKRTPCSTPLSSEPITTRRDLAGATISPFGAFQPRPGREHHPEALVADCLAAWAEQWTSRGSSSTPTRGKFTY
jgi:hypothetical protein